MNTTDNKTQVNTSFDSENLSNATMHDNAESHGTPWKELSIGGAFGVLLAGGGLYASGAMKGSDEESLLAGAQASDSVHVETGKPEPEQKAEVTNEDPVMLDDNGNPITPVSHQEVANRIEEVTNEAANQHHAHAAASHQAAAAAQSAHDASASHITINVYHNDQPADSGIEYMNDPSVHPVNITTIDDSLTFADAWAVARDQMGPGQAFIWRGGVYGTFNQHEWNSLSHDEQHEFTSIAVREYQEIEFPEYFANNHEPVHFVEGNVVNGDEVIAIDDNQYVEEAAHHVGDDDVLIIETQTDPSIELPEVITLDNSLDGMEQIEAILDINGDGVVNDADILDTVAAIINDNPEVMDGLGALDTLYEAASNLDTVDDIPDYVSDADTLGLI